MDYKDIMNVGGSIFNTVTAAIEQNDYSTLSKDIRQQVESFTEQIKREQDEKRRAQYGAYSNNAGYGQQKEKVTLYPNGKTAYGNGSAQYGRPQSGTGYAHTQQSQSGYTNTQQSQSGYAHTQQSQSAYSTYSQSSTGYGTSGYGSAAYAQARPSQNTQYNANTSQKKKSGMGTFKKKIAPFLANKPRYTGSLIKIGLGAIGCVLFGSISLMFIPELIAAFDMATLAAMIITGSITAASAWMVTSGAKGKRLVDKFYKYSRAVGDAEYFSVEDLANYMDETPAETKKSLERMMDKKLLPNGRFDRKKTTVMLTNEAFTQYQNAESARIQREKQAAAEQAQTDSLSDETRAILSEGEAYIRKVREANNRIPDETMTAKLDRLEQIVNRIFDRVRTNPENGADLRRFMNYYLPTTEKLLNAYIDLDKQPQVGENIANTKKEITEAVDTINNAFENLLDSLFEDVAWDVSSDISVMKTMMEQDGLTERPLNAK
ncbi:MAG: 5-bromo-4-chloroindolyl phosphate hydrolysis family protein [Eubacterium sp.]|nr:5-bromo-4-chloroindolyl phosphate hydrolysis family protein [Eubacterium sp.]